MGKHRKYSLKLEIAIGPDGRACFVGTPYYGLYHDMKIIKMHLKENMERLKKKGDNTWDKYNRTKDNVDNCYMWEALVDHGYQGACKLGRFLLPKKKQLDAIWTKTITTSAGALRHIRSLMRFTLVV